MLDTPPRPAPWRRGDAHAFTSYMPLGPYGSATLPLRARRRPGRRAGIFHAGMNMENLLDRHYHVDQPELRACIDEFLRLAGASASDQVDLYRAMLWTCARIAQEDLDRWDVKILTNTLGELFQAFGELRHYHRRRKVTVFGSARTPGDAAEYALATATGRALAQDGFMVITGAGGGVMQAAHEGAGAQNSLGFNIELPFEQEPNPVIHSGPGLFTFRFFFIRKLFLVKEADALIVFPGGFGTQDETFELLTLIQTGKSPLVPVILMDVPGGSYWQRWQEFVSTQMAGRGRISAHDLRLVHVAERAEDAAREIARFYHNFHSMRWVGNELRLRYARALPEPVVQRLNREFADLLETGDFAQVTAHSSERDEIELVDLFRIAFRFNHRDYGRLRQLIDVINEY